MFVLGLGGLEEFPELALEPAGLDFPGFADAGGEFTIANTVHSIFHFKIITLTIFQRRGFLQQYIWLKSDKKR